MTAEVAIQEDNTPSVVQQQASMQSAAVARLGDWAASAEAAYGVAEKLVQTSFVPEAFRGKPYEATGAILAGAEVGLSPMAALRSFDVIQGTAAPRALTLRAVVQSQGHEMIVDDSTASRCVMRGRRRGASEWVTVTWTMDRAKQLGLTSKPNWKNQPTTMLAARATSELARLIAADAILGIGYTVEEIGDGAAVESAPTPAPAEPSGSRKMQRKKSAPSTPEPDATPEPEPTPVGDAPETVTKAQLTKMHACLTDLGVTDRDSGLAIFSDYAGRQVESSKELTKDEASRVIDQLENEIRTQQSTPEPK